jgi:hypothetical protein
MKRVPFDFDDPPFPVFGYNSAARRALPASCGIPGSFPGYHIVWCMNQRKKGLICFRGAACSNGDTPHPGNLKKCSPIHLQKLLLENQNTKTTQMKCKKGLATKKHRLKTVDAF